MIVQDRRHIVAVIVDYYTRSEALALAGDLEAQSEIQGIVLVDNTGDAAYGAGWPELPAGVTVLLRAERAGFGSGVNFGALSVDESADYLLVLNSDVRITSGSFQRLAARLEREKLGAVGPRIVDTSGRLQQDAFGHFPRTWRLPGTGSSGIEWITGACFLTSLRTFRDVGGFDERYFMYWEDADYCRKLQHIGLRVNIGAEVTVMHTMGASNPSALLRYARARESRNLFLHKWGSNSLLRLMLLATSRAKLLWLRWRA